MRQFILTIFILLNVSTSFGADYNKIDKQSESVPANLKTAKEIAQYLTRNLTTPVEKTRAIYYWITHNIKYDLKKMKLNRTYTNPQELVNDVLQKRQGVCANYTALFQACCQSVGIQSFVIEGYVRQNGKLVLNGHAWNAVKIANKFYYIDPTWASGYVEGAKFKQKFYDEYFMISPVDFIKTHMPLDPLWQFSSNPITFKEFDANNFQKLEGSSNFNFSDSIKTLSVLSPLEKLQREKQRIKQCGISNSFVKEYIVYLTNNIDIEEHNLVAGKFNQAVKLFNNSVSAYNKYVFNRKKSNIITLNNAPILLDLLDSSRREAESASRILNELKTKDLKLSNEISNLKRAIETEFKNIGVEIQLINEYLRK